MTPKARKPAHARPAPRPNRLVKDEAIQSVVSTVVVGLGGFCCCTFIDAGGGGVCCSEEVVLCGSGGGFGVCDDEEKWGILLSGWDRNGGELKKVDIIKVLINLCW